MLPELDQSQFATIRPLVSGLAHRPAVEAVIAGTCAGRVFVDNLAQPNSCFIWERPGIYYVAGRETNEEFNSDLSALFTTAIIPSKPEAYWGYICPGSSAWGQVIPSLVPTRTHKRTCFVMPPAEAPAGLDARAVVHRGFRIQPVTEDLLTSSLVNIEGLRAELNHMWVSPAAFFRWSFGVCITCGDELASWCLAEYISQGSCGIGIETVKDFQRQGLATAAASVLVGRAVREGFTVHWDTSSSNQASQAVARKLGFPRELEYEVLSFHYGGS